MSSGGAVLSTGSFSFLIRTASTISTVWIDTSSSESDTSYSGTASSKEFVFMMAGM